MFKKSSTNKQFDLFNSPSDLMCGRESRVYDNPSAWHNKFYREVTCNIDEEIFRPLFAKDREDKKEEYKELLSRFPFKDAAETEMRRISLKI